MSHPIFIFEGPDAVGKTTLAQSFMSRTGASYLHMTLRKRMYLYQLASLRLAICLSKRAPVIIDRHWPSENIYAGVYRGGTRLRAETENVAGLCTRLGVVYVYCHLDSAQDEAAAHRSTAQTGREMYAPDDRILQVAQAYRDWWYGSKDMEDRFALCGEIARAGGQRLSSSAIGYSWKDPLWRGRTALFIDHAIARGYAIMANCSVRNLVFDQISRYAK